MISQTGSAITAQDFNHNTKDPLRNEWSPGAMHHLIKALNGAPVAIVLEKATGFAEFNVTLGGVRKTPGYGTFQVLVQRTYSDGKTGGCWYPLYSVGTVIELGNSHARWDALRSYSDEQTRAIVQLQHDMMGELEIENRDALPRGTWEARVFPGYVHASYTPEKFGAPVKYTWKRYQTKDLVKA